MPYGFLQVLGECFKKQEQPQAKMQELSVESTVENSIYYNMYKEEKAENKILVEE